MSRSCTVSRINKTRLPKSAIQCEPEGKANSGRPVKISAEKSIRLIENWRWWQE